MRNSSGLSTVAVIGTLSLCLAPVAKAGVLVLKNGDRITGEIKAIWDHEITRKIVASLKGGDAEGNQILFVDGEQIAAPVMQLYELDKIDDPVEWDSYVDWSAAVNRGNTDSLNTKLAADTTLTMGDHRHIGDLTIIREDQNGLATKEQDLVRYNYNWLFNDPWFFSAGLSLERDPIRELDKRAVLTAGMGRDIWNTPRLTLNVQLGAGVVTEEIANSSEQSSVVSWALRYRQDLFSEDLEVFHNDSIVYYVGGRTNTIFKTTTGLHYEITDLLYAVFSIDFDYETEPAATATNEDVAVLFGLGVEF
jgi:putative salt-induced outer membrane protein YdiY